MLINYMLLCCEVMIQGVLSFTSEGARNNLPGHHPEIYDHLRRTLM